ncbi:MAG: hypothetical protein O2867_08430 [Bacteroidetes bacterium]|nr:hypothetical protein [Bacteroidota bacterium]
MKSTYHTLRFFWILLLGSALFLTSCEDACDTPDVDAINAIYLQFDTSGDPGSFQMEELDSVYMVRFQIADFDSFNFPVDTFNLFENEFYEDPYKVRLSRDFPRGLIEGPPYYTDFMYLFQSYGQDFRVRLQSIELDGGYTDDCTYVNREKSFVLNDDTLDQTGSTEFVLMSKD